MTRAFTRKYAERMGIPVVYVCSTRCIARILRAWRNRDVAYYAQGQVSDEAKITEYYHLRTVFAQ